MKSIGFSQRAKLRKHLMPPFLPDFVADSILEVDFQFLRSLGITHLMLDLDQTLKHKHSPEIEVEIIEHIKAARTEAGFKDIFIVTNNSRDIRNFGKDLDAKIFQPYRTRTKTIRKPNRKFYKNVLQISNINPEHAVMIGDKLKFDIAGANRVGIHTVFVNPLGKDYLLDTLFFTRFRDRRRLSSAKVKVGLFSTSGTELHLKEALKQVNFNAKKVEAYNVDARGSQPYLATDGKRKVFIKLITRKTNFFDWMFKLGQRLLFRRLEDEMPFVSPRQAVEHEAYISSLAQNAGVRTPKIIGQVDLHDHRHGLVIEFVEGSIIDAKQAKHLNDKVLIDLWHQVHKLHQANIAHRDLRAANMILDKKRQVWLIDYDFATTAATVNNIQKDNVELLVSLGNIIGAKKSIKFASTVLNHSDYRKLLPLLRYRTLSTATKKDARKNKDLLSKLRDFVEVLSIETDS